MLLSVEMTVGYGNASHWFRDSRIVHLFEPYWDNPRELELARGDVLVAELTPREGNRRVVEISIPEIESDSPELFEIIRPFFHTFRHRPLWLGPNGEIGNPQDIGKP